MKRFVFTDPNDDTIRAEFKVDRTDGHFQVLDVVMEGEDAAIVKGIDFKKLDYHKEDFVSFAEDNNLSLFAYPIDGDPTTLVEGVVTTTTTTTSTTTTTTTTTTGA